MTTLQQSMVTLLSLMPALTSAYSPTWTALFSRGPHVSGHATAVDESTGRVLCFGGLTGSAGSPCTNDLFAYDGAEWTELTTSVGGPGPRMYAASACLGNSFFLFGGWDPEAPGSGGSFKDDVWRLDLDSFTWEQ